MTVRTVIEGWAGAAVSSIVNSGFARIEFGSSGYLIAFAPLAIHLNSSTETIDPLEATGELTDTLSALVGSLVTEAHITEMGSLRLRLDRALIVVDPDDASEAFQLSQTHPPRMLVSGPGGEIFEWSG